MPWPSVRIQGSSLSYMYIIVIVWTLLLELFSQCSKNVLCAPNCFHLGAHVLVWHLPRDHFPMGDPTRSTRIQTTLLHRDSQTSPTWYGDSPQRGGVLIPFFLITSLTSDGTVDKTVGSDHISLIENSLCIDESRSEDIKWIVVSQRAQSEA